MKTNSITPKLGPVLQQFFVERLMQQRHASGCTVAAYRDCFRLLLGFAERRIGKRPADLTLQDLDASLVLDFLSHLEKQRHNSARSRNARFAAIRSFMHYAGLKEPAALAVTQSVLAIPHAASDRGHNRCTHYEHLGGTARLCDVRDALQHRCSGLGAHCHAGHGFSVVRQPRRSHPWERPQGALCTSVACHSHPDSAVAACAPSGTRGSGLRKPFWHRAHPHECYGASPVGRTDRGRYPP